jgi:hypothetical protein
MLAKTETMIAADEPPVSLMSGDYWTAWTDGNHHGMRNARLVCPDGTFVDFLDFKEQTTGRGGRGYGIVDADIHCTPWGGPFWKFETNNVNGRWNQGARCNTGFKKLVAEEQAGKGLTNFKAFCGNTYEESNGNEDGAWDGEHSSGGHCVVQPCTVMDCNDDVIAGIQSREQSGYGIINIRILCRPKRREVKHIAVQMTELLSVSGGSAGYIDRRVTSSLGSKSTHSTSSEMSAFLKTKIDASIDYGVFSASASVEAGIKTAVKSAASQETTSFQEVVETLHIDLSRPCYVYQATITTTFDDGSVLLQKGVTTTLSKQVQNPYQQIM